MRNVVGLLQELQRRRVFRVAVLYAGVSFVLLQAADLILPALNATAGYTILVVLVLIGLPITLVVAWIFDLTPTGVVRTAPLPPEVARVRTLDAGAVAVLPFKDIGGAEESTYFSDGITDDIQAHVARLRDLKVISRTSASQYRGVTKALPQIAAELGVAYIVEGSVRRSTDRVRIVVQLIDARTDAHVWGDTYDRPLEDVFAIQSDVARRVAMALRANLTAGELARLERAPTRDLTAYELYLRARREWNQRTSSSMQRSIGLLHRAIAADPQFALAHAALADSAVTLGVYGLVAPRETMEPARAAAETAIELDAEAGEPHAALACVHALYDWDWTRAEQGFRRAIGRSPQYATAHQWYAMNLLVPLRRFEEARASLELASELDPVAPVLRASFGVLAFYRRDWATGARIFSELLRSHSSFAMAHYFLGMCLAELGRSGEAIRELETAVARSDGSAETLAALAYTRASARQHAAALRLLSELEARSRTEYVSPSRLAQTHVALGDRASALACLESALTVRAVDLAWIDVNPRFDDIRDDPAFQAVARAVVPASRPVTSASAAN